MRRISLFVALMTVAAPSYGFSSYRIQLKNGNEWITNEYRQSKRVIQFQMSGGVVTLSMRLVQSIEESDIPYRDRSDYGHRPSKPLSSVKSVGQKTLQNDLNSGETSQATLAGTGDGTLNLRSYIQKNRQLKERLDAALQRLYLSSRDKDMAAKERARLDAREISRSIYQLTAELQNRNGGRLPENWWKGPDASR